MEHASPHASQDAAASAVRFRRLRAAEFARLDERGETYLDYTGSALYPASLVHRHRAQLEGAVLGNPHSDSPSSRASTALIDAARARVLAFFDADPAEYCVIFTANASAAIRLVAEAFPFGARSRLLLSSDNHNSINGIREYAGRQGARVAYMPLDDELRLDGVQRAFKAVPSGSHLFAYPAQSNFSGVLHPLELIDHAQASGYRVLLDAAAYVPSNPLSLRTVRPDFVALSFYKMFGYPTGVGALIARRDALAHLTRPWFAGGTVQYVSVHERTHRLADGEAAFEDGTADFLGIAAIPAGLDWLDRLGMAAVAQHIRALTAHALAALHASDCVSIHGPATVDRRGGTIAFSVLNPQGSTVPFQLVDAHARAAGISIRSGCFCNPGAAERALGVPLTSGATGALRCSFGPATTRSDIARLVSLVASVAYAKGGGVERLVPA